MSSTGVSEITLHGGPGHMKTYAVEDRTDSVLLKVMIPINPAEMAGLTDEEKQARKIVVKTAAYSRVKHLDRPTTDFEFDGFLPEDHPESI